MAFVIVNLASEYLPDGSFHVYSPDVPGFHVVDHGSKNHEQVFRETALPVLQETMTRRVVEAKAGERVLFTDQSITEIGSFVPEELSRRLRKGHRPSGIPRHLIAEII